MMMGSPMTSVRVYVILQKIYSYQSEMCLGKFSLREACLVADGSPKLFSSIAIKKIEGWVFLDTKLPVNVVKESEE